MSSSSKFWFCVNNHGKLDSHINIFAFNNCHWWKYIRGYEIVCYCCNTPLLAGSDLWKWPLEISTGGSVQHFYEEQLCEIFTCASISQIHIETEWLSVFRLLGYPQKKCQMSNEKSFLSQYNWLNNNWCISVAWYPVLIIFCPHLPSIHKTAKKTP